MTPLTEIQSRNTCRVCHQKLEIVLELGELRLNAFPTTLEEIEDVPRVPHTLAVCRGCGLAQLIHTVPPDWMYRQYYYLSGVNEMMQQELLSIVQQARGMVPLTSKDSVLDIGANDGTLLSYYKVSGWETPTRIAVDPADNLQDRLSDHCDIRVHGYFPTDHLSGLAGGIKIITAIACSYDLEDPVGFFTAIRTLLHPEGVAIVQFQDMGQQISSCAFDNIVPEHLEYYTLGSLLEVVKRASLQVVDCLTTPINGGSLRVTLRPQAHAAVNPRASLMQQLAIEDQQGLGRALLQGDLSAYHAFAKRVALRQLQIRSTLESSLAQHATIDLYGASTKGNVLAQMLGLGPGQVRQAIDRSVEKHGRYTVTGVPIVGEEQGRKQPADVWIVPIWQFKPSVLERNQWFLDGGGQIIFPLPAVEIVARGRG
jgi:NDP-4-keto-2,6-dideoxyhexose 3-C-methyltransferase